MDETTEISYCALYCGNCFIRNGAVADQAQNLLDEFKKVNFEAWAEGLAMISPEMRAFSHCRECLDVLKAWDSMRCIHSCKEGGGSTGCRIRECCLGKGLNGCWECDLHNSCETLDWLKPVNGEINHDNIELILKEGTDVFIRKMKKQKYSAFHK